MSMCYLVVCYLWVTWSMYDDWRCAQIGYDYYRIVFNLTEREQHHQVILKGKSQRCVQKSLYIIHHTLHHV